MKLKLLTITGFKSFPQRTRLQFADGISAIVGPNGCGKSNIVDAIRWVLGEQSPAIIRAKSMDEVINNGDTKRQINFAEVSLTLTDTERLQLPWLDGSPSIEISRRITRSGDSEYRINGRAARLKDVQLVFMDTGVGTRAYSIIDQGQVSQFVEMDAARRRIILDEAAGIARYRLRRQETGKRLQETRENLARLQDIIAEVDGQKQRLSTQVASARRYLALRERQELLQKAIAACSWQELCQTKTNLETKLNKCSTEHADFIAVSSALHARSNAIETQCSLLEAETNDLQKLLEQTEDKRERIAYELSQKEKQLLSGEHNLKNHHTIVEEQKKRRQNLERVDKELDEEIMRIKMDVQGLQRQITILEKELEDIIDLRDNIRQSLDAAKNSYVDTAAIYARLDTERRANKAQYERIKQKQLSIEREVASLANEVLLKTKECNQIKNDIEKLEVDEAELNQKVKQEVEAEAKLNQEIKKMEQKKITITNQLATTTARLNALREIEDSDVKNNSNKKLPYKCLADYVKVKEGKERLIDIVMHNVARTHVIHLDGVEKIYDRIKDELAGQPNIVVPELAHRVGQIKPEGLVNCLEYEDSLKDLIMQIAGTAMIATDLSEAINIARLNKQINNNASVISKTGEIIYPTGEIKFTQHTIKKGIFTQRAEIARLKNEEEKLKAELSELTILQQALISQSNTIFNELKNIRNAIQKNQTLKSNLLFAFEKARNRLDYLQEKNAQADIDVEELRSQLTEYEIELERIEEKLEKIAVTKASAEGAIKGRETAMRQQDEVVARRRKGIETIKIRLAEAQLSLKNKKLEKNNAIFKLDRLKKDIESSSEKKQIFEKMVFETEKELSVFQKQFEDIEEEVYKHKSRIKSKRDEFDNHRQMFSDAKHKLNEVDAKLKETEKSLHKLEIEKTQLQQQEEHLKLYAVETFRVDIEEAWQAWVQQDFNPDIAQKDMKSIEKEISGLGPVNLAAMEEYDAIESRHNFLSLQKTDLEASILDIQKAMEHLNQTCRQKLKETLIAINKELFVVFPILFEGGEAALSLTDEDDVLDSGAEYNLRLPGKKIQNISLLSGGEKAMAAIALIFSLFAIKPSPFCLLDEVDAPLDETNTLRFNRLVQKMAEGSQVVLITHNQRIMEIADRLYGVTMEEKGCSKIVSVDLR